MLSVSEEVLDQEACWVALSNRDKSFDSRFYVGVLTTGVYCRPSCGSRRPNRENVRFFPSTSEAKKAGLRACLRCKPDDVLSPSEITATRISELCSYIREHCHEPLPLSVVSERVGLSPFHLQRTFKATVGMSPKEFVDACRLGKLKSSLRQEASVTHAVYDAGYGSSSRVYERTETRIGMTPGQYRDHGAGTSISYATYASPLGLMMMAATDRGLCFLQFGESEQELVGLLHREFPLASITEAAMREPLLKAQFRGWIDRLDAYLRGESTSLNLPLEIRATSFEAKVWNFLQTIPHGEVRSYAQVAEALGTPKAARAVARACASNRVAIVIPCHRVLRGTGALAGYRWGLDRKKTLLKLEGNRSVAVL